MTLTSRYVWLTRHIATNQFVFPEYNWSFHHLASRPSSLVHARRGTVHYKGITAQKKTYDYVVTSLAPKFAMEVHDLICNFLKLLHQTDSKNNLNLSNAWPLQSNAICSICLMWRNWVTGNLRTYTAFKMNATTTGGQGH